MKAALLKDFGPPEVLGIGEVDSPAPGPGEVAVRVKACALNHLDLWLRKGLPAYKLELPHVLGSDISGEIEALGPDSGPWKVGDPVLVHPGRSCWKCSYCLDGRDNLCERYGILGADGGWGGYAQTLTVSARNLLPKPQSLAWEEAAAFPLTYLTAWHMLVGKAALRGDQKVLILGASSGVGSAAIQIAKLHGAHVVAASRAPEKASHAEKLGADEVVTGDDPFKAAKRLERKGFDVVFEHVGGDYFEKAIPLLRPGGVLVTCGATKGTKPALDLRYVFFKELSIHGIKMGTFNEMKRLVQLADEGKLKPAVSKTFALEEAAAAHAFLEGGKQAGKVVLTL